MSKPADSPSEKNEKSALHYWLIFVATFPLGMIVGHLFGIGQDAAGRGIAIGLGMIGVGLFGSIPAAVFVSKKMIQIEGGKLLACLPWLILASYCWMLVTPTGDRLAEWLQRL